MKRGISWVGFILLLIGVGWLLIQCGGSEKILDNLTGTWVGKLDDGYCKIVIDYSKDKTSWDVYIGYTLDDMSRADYGSILKAEKVDGEWHIVNHWNKDSRDNFGFFAQNYIIYHTDSGRLSSKYISQNQTKNVFFIRQTNEE